MRSCIYEGYVEHRRFQPVEHHFRYPLYFYCFDPSELEALDRDLPLFGYNRFRPASIYDADYLDHEQGSIQEKLHRILAEEPFAKLIARFILVTSARYFNYIFNPVSFYYCLSEEDNLLCLISEVTNTFGEKHLYILRKPEGQVPGYMARYTAAKDFHVSPFNSIEGQYEFLVSGIGQELDIRVNLRRNDETIFAGQLWGSFVPLTSRHHARMILRHPLLPHLAMPRIIFEAAKLHFLKKLTIYNKPLPLSIMTIKRKPPTLFQKICMKVIRRLFETIREGGIKMLLPDRQSRYFGNKNDPLQAEIRINDYRFFSDIVLDGDIGLGESYMEGLWDTPDIVPFFRILIKNRDALSNGYPATAWLKRQKNRLSHWFQPNTLSGARRNIRSHYDLSNAFYECFLDSSMTYSCGIYLSPETTLAEAQQKKLRTIIQKAGIGENDHVLEIGCGWGSFALEAAKQTGCRITGITVSEAQYKFARDLVKAEGLNDRITILLRDYREIDGVYDKIVSIEMLEAVGHNYLGKFFSCVEQLLKPGGLLVLQVITIPDERYKQYLRETDWFQKHIFPGGELLSVAALKQSAAQHSNLLLESLEDIGQDYAKTLQDWRLRFNEHLGKIAVMGFDRLFQRKWFYYLATCEAGFVERALGDMQAVFRKP